MGCSDDDGEVTNTNPSKPVAMIDGESLPPGWFKAMDPNYNCPYYYNLRSGERSWKKPKVKLPQGWFSGMK